MHILSFTAILVLIIGVAYSIKPARSVNDDVADSVIKTLNRSIDPCIDFYQFACGGWLHDAVIPDDESRYTRSFSNIEKHNSEVLSSILNSTSDKMLSTFYESCMNTSGIDARGIDNIQSILELIDAKIDDENLIPSVFYMVGYLQKFKFINFFEIFSATDPGNPEINIAQLNQGGLKIPKSIYTNESSPVFLKYREHVATMFELVGLNSSLAEYAIQVELSISKQFQSDEELDDPFATYNKMDYDQLKLRYSNLFFDYFISGIDTSFNYVNVLSVKYFDRLNDIIGFFDRKSFVAYLQWSTLNSVAEYLPKRISDEHFNFFGKILRGEETQPERSRICVTSADESIGFLVGKYFVEKTFPQEAKDLNIKMIKQVEEAFKEVLNKLDWMDEETKNAALTKLGQVVDRVGYPDQWPSYDSVTVQDDYFINKLAFRLFDVNKILDSFDKEVDRSLWEMTPSTVNAYYEPTSNTINFPAGILYAPYFSLDFPIEMNYGGVGLIMGHELSHGFDNHGRLYDGKGKLENWWSKESGEKFVSRTQCLVDQYNNFCPIEGHCVNGKLTLGENIADNAGLKEAFLALRATIGDEEGNKPSIVNFLTRYQLFFTAFAQGWCAKTRPEEVLRRLETDVHSPPEYRVIGSIVNSPFFGDAFQCSTGSPMNPENKCDIF